MNEADRIRAGGFVVSVESIRGIAALCVAIAHTMDFTLPAHYSVPFFELPTAREMVLRVTARLVNGDMAVSLFFAISGFVIGRSLDKRDKAPAGHSYLMFLLHRIFRLYPAHIVSIAGVILLALVFFVGKAPIDFSPYRSDDNPFFADTINGTVFNPIRLTSIIGNLAMATWSMNLVVWSLYVEACAAPLLPAFHRISRVDNGYLDVATVVALIGISAALWGQLWIEYWFIFYLGMIVQTRGREWAQFVTRHIGAGTAVAISYAVTVFPELFFHGRPLPVFIAESLGTFSILSLIVWCNKPDVFRILEHPVLRWNGRLSYSFYLWHFIVLTIVTRQLYASLSPETMHRYEIVIFTVTILGTAALALGIAQLSYSFVERPFISVGRKVVSTWRQTAFGRTVASSP